MRGHLRKTSKHAWSIVLSLGRDPLTGKRRQKWVTVRGTRHDAEARLGDLLQQAEQGRLSTQRAVTFAQLCERWLRDYAVPRVRPRTIEGYRTIIDRHFLPKLGHLKLRQITPDAVQAYEALLLCSGRQRGHGKGLSACTVLHHHRLLSEILRRAVRWGLLPTNPADAVDPPRVPRFTPRVPDRDELARFLRECRASSHAALFVLDILTGLRRGELLGLRWRDVDWRAGAISVVQVVNRLNGGRFIIEEPKSGKGRRVTLPPAGLLALQHQRDRRAAERAMMGLRPAKPDDLVFDRPDGSPMSPNAITSAWRRSARRAGLVGVRLHDLRHLHATMLMEKGVQMKVVQERLGHSSIAITADTYSHVTPGLQGDAAEQIAAALPEAVFDESLKVDVTQIRRGGRAV